MGTKKYFISSAISFSTMNSGSSLSGGNTTITSFSFSSVFYTVPVGKRAKVYFADDMQGNYHNFYYKDVFFQNTEYVASLTSSAASLSSYNNYSPNSLTNELTLKLATTNGIWDDYIDGSVNFFSRDSFIVSKSSNIVIYLANFYSLNLTNRRTFYSIPQSNYSLYNNSIAFNVQAENSSINLRPLGRISYRFNIKRGDTYPVGAINNVNGSLEPLARKKVRVSTIYPSVSSSLNNMPWRLAGNSFSYLITSLRMPTISHSTGIGWLSHAASQTAGETVKSSEFINVSQSYMSVEQNIFRNHNSYSQLNRNQNYIYLQAGESINVDFSFNRPYKNGFFNYSSSAAWYSIFWSGSFSLEFTFGINALIIEEDI